MTGVATRAHLVGDLDRCAGCVATKGPGGSHPDHQKFAVLVVAVEHYAVDATFPRLTRNLVPQGVLEARYEIALPSAQPEPEVLS